MLRNRTLTKLVNIAHGLTALVHIEIEYLLVVIGFQLLIELVQVIGPSQ